MFLKLLDFAKIEVHLYNCLVSPPHSRVLLGKDWLELGADVNYVYFIVLDLMKEGRIQE
jgi:hypothetical protein